MTDVHESKSDAAVRHEGWSASAVFTEASGSGLPVAAYARWRIAQLELG